MKIISMAAAVALAGLPAIGFAQSAPTTTNDSPSTIEPGGVAQEGLEEFTLGNLPFEAVIAGGFVLIGGAVIGILIGSDSDSNPAPATSTN